jgi:apolipoprotein N-acyltransferase
MVTIGLAAFFASAAFAPLAIWYLGVIGYSLFLRKLSNTSKPIIASFLFGLIYNAIVLHWSGKFVGALPWILLALLQGLFYIPVGIVAHRFKSIWLTSGALLAMEELRSVFPFGGFGWTRIGFGQVDSPAASILPYGGVLALSALTLVFATLLTKIRFGNFLKIGVILILLAMLPSNPQGSGSVNLIAIQGNTPSVGLEFNSRAQAVFNLHRDATYKYVSKKYDAIIWPENAIDIDPSLNPSVAEDIAELVERTGSPLVAGVVLKRDSSPLNASVMYQNGGTVASTYIKRGLTPFGEFMPLRAIAEFVSPFASSVTDFKKGENLQTHRISDSVIGPVICYEIINDSLVTEMSANSQALIVQTNSATFAGTPESRQQLAITRIRAIENSRSILSVSTIGITAFIDENGNVLSQTGENVQAALVGDLSLNSKKTLANKWGIELKIFILLLFLFFGYRTNRKKLSYE